MRRLRATLRDTVANLMHDMTTTIATVLTAAVALSLLGVALLANAQIAAMKDHWYDKVEVAVFLCTDKSMSATCNGEPSAAAKEVIFKQLRQLPGVEAVYYETRDQAWDAFSARFEGTGITDTVTRQALPESFRVKMVNPSQGYIVEAAASGVPGIESIQDQRKLLSRFFNLLEKVQTAATTAALVASLAAAVLIATGVRVTVAYRRREIAVMRLVGAHASKIRRPFLLASIVQGLLGGLLAGSSVLALKAWFIDTQAAGTSFAQTVSWASVLNISMTLVGTGCAIAIAVSLGTLARHLRR